MQLRGVLACLALACADAGPFGRKKNAKVEVAASGALAAGADGPLAALDAELAATEALIAASQRKVELLGALRRAGGGRGAAGGGRRRVRVARGGVGALVAAPAARRGGRRRARRALRGRRRGRRRRRAAAAAAAERLRRPRRRRRLRRGDLVMDKSYVGAHDDLPAGQRRGRRGPSVPVFNYVNLLLLAYDNGTIAFHDAAGEVVAAVDTGHAGASPPSPSTAPRPVLATAGAGGEVHGRLGLAVADGAVVRFVSSSRWRLSPAVCRGPPATVSDVAFDALNPGVLHVAYETGELLAFNTRARQGDGGAPACRLTTKLPSSPHVAPPKLATTKGFLVSSSAHFLAIHNTTVPGPGGYRLVAAQRLANESDAAPPHKFAASFVAGMSMQEILFAYGGRGAILRKNGGGRGGGAFGKLGGGRGGISDVDMDAINQMAERMGRNGEGGDMAAAMAGLGGMGGGGMGAAARGGFSGAGGRRGPRAAADVAGALSLRPSESLGALRQVDWGSRPSWTASTSARSRGSR
ncbi:hypothetical protein JL722_7585 [Aureococcus anophagefferens]|nr:hypothetical protein JL722_7585 [Aureococcus anophagefferens]